MHLKKCKLSWYQIDTNYIIVKIIKDILKKIKNSISLRQIHIGPGMHIYIYIYKEK